MHVIVVNRTLLARLPSGVAVFCRALIFYISVDLLLQYVHYVPTTVFGYVNTQIYYQYLEKYRSNTILFSKILNHYFSYAVIVSTLHKYINTRHKLIPNVASSGRYCGYKHEPLVFII